MTQTADSDARVVGSRRRLAGLRPSELHPIYPAMVMGTGSLSSGALLLDVRALSDALFIIAVVAFSLLCVLAFVRLVRHGKLLRADARNPRSAFAPYIRGGARGSWNARNAR